MTTRQEVADALNGTQLVKASAKKPSVLAAPGAWVQVAGHERSDGFFQTNWRAWVVLSSDVNVAADWYDQNIDALRDALEAVIYVDNDAPAEIVTGAGNLFGLIIEGHSE